MFHASASATTLLAIAVTSVAGGGLVAQSTLAQLGLTESAARNFVIDEIKTPAGDRRSAIVIAGNRAFLKLSPSARGVAATSLFSWAKAYVSSPAFTASYAAYRKDRSPTSRQYDLTVDEAVKKDLDEQLAGFEEMKQRAASLPPADRAENSRVGQEGERDVDRSAIIKQLRAELAAKRAQEGGNDVSLTTKVDETTQADPRRLFARRLREFLDATADVNFSARTISLTGGPDGIEFIDRADRKKPWLWQEAVIVGPEATAAARAAAQAWLKEIER